MPSKDRHEYYLRNKDHICALTKKWAKDNPDKRRTIGRKYAYKHPEQILFNSAKQRAIRFKLEFNLELSDIIIPERCPLLEIPILYFKDKHGKNKKYKYEPGAPSVDRIDNTKGYVKGNIWVISRLANNMKSSASEKYLKIFACNIMKIFK
jgi:hypothetical protein